MLSVLRKLSNSLKTAITHNIGLKTTAIILAIFFWILARLKL